MINPHLIDMIKKKLLFIVLFITHLQITASDLGVIEGRVFNITNNNPVEFATIVIEGTTIATISDLDGNFKFTGIKPGFTQLQVNFLGYEPYTTERFQVTNAKKVYVEIPLKEKLQKLDEVVVTKSVFRRNEESPVSLRRISIEQIEKNPGGNRDISRVIQSFPGVSSTPSFRNDVIVRGGGSSENRFYLDGVEIPNINHFATQGASGGPVGIINVDFVREVNFYSSAFQANRGNALSSVLDFRQIDGNKDKLKFKAAIGASDLALTLDGPLSEKTTFIASARRSYLQFLFQLLELPFLPIYNDFQFKTRTWLDPKNEITVIGLGAIDNNKLNLEANETEEQKYILGYIPSSSQWNYTLGIVYRHYRDNGNDSWILSRNMLQNEAEKYFNNQDDIPQNKILDYESFEAENKFRYERSTQYESGFKFNSGAGVEYARYYNNTFRKVFGSSPDIYETNTDLFKFSLFSQVSKKYLNELLTLSGGIRTDFSTYSDRMLNPLNQLSPRISASYEFTPGWFINANTGIYYAIPPYTSLGYKDTSGVLINKKNNLKYIRSDHYVGGLEYQPNPQARFTIESFVKNYSNYPFSIRDSISIASKGSDFGTFGDEEIRSTGKGRAYGLEFLFQHRKLAGTDVTLSYTLVRSEFLDKNNKYVPSAWDNKHILNLLVRRQFKYNVDIGAKWRFVGGSPYTPVDLQKSELVEAWDNSGFAYKDYSRFNTSRLKPFHQLDIRVDKSFFYSSWSIIAYLDIQNLYNFQADSQPEYLLARDSNGEPIMQGTTPERYQLKQLDRSGGGTVLPTFGIIVEF